MRTPLVLLVSAIMSLAAQGPRSFEVASVRPDSGPLPGIPAFLGRQTVSADTITMRHTVLNVIIQRAYDIVPQQLAGGPDWVTSERFDIVGKSAVPASEAELWSMVRPLLEERFKFRYHRESREVSGLAMSLGKNPKLTKSEGGPIGFQMEPGKGLIAHNVSMSRLAQLLSGQAGRVVLDATGLEDGYDFSVDLAAWAGTPLHLAVANELGLKMESRKVETQIMVIDHIERPSEN